MNNPKILFIDIETSPIISFTWGLFDQNVGLNQIKEDWNIISYSAKWANKKKIFYGDLRGRDLKNDKPLLKEIWNLLDEADIVVGQNSKAFDIKKINARLIAHGMKPPSSFKQMDTLSIARKHFGFTSNKLEYMTSKLNKKYKKLDHGKFPGFALWSECLKDNKMAWEELRRYNINDVLSTEELYSTLAPWDRGIDFNLYHNSDDIFCKCGSDDFEKNGYAYTASGKYQRYRCRDCGSETRSKENLLTPEKRKSLRPGTR